MTNRERMLAIMEGRSPDRIPWIPRLRIWHTAHARQGTLPARFRDLDRRQIEQELDMGTPARGGRVFTVERGGDVEVTTSREGSTAVTAYRTPVGSVTTRERSSDELDRLGIQSLEVEHMIKGPEDFAVVEYLVTHTRYEPAYDDFRAYEARIGDDGVPLVGAGDCPFHLFLQELAGYTNGYYLLSDCSEQVEHLLMTMEEVERDTVWPLVAESPARLILHGIHFDSTLTPPRLFSRYITPYYRDFSDLLHRRDKTLCMHADNDSRLILRHLEEAGFDMVESFTTAPQVSCTLEDARETWGNRVIIWGGLPSVLLEPTYSEEDFEAYMRQLFRTIAPGDAFILGVADNVMPDALVERLERVSEMVTSWGNYPIDPARIA